MSIYDFDYIWVHSQVLPESIIRELGNENQGKLPAKFIFLHMSPMDWIPDERPYICGLEEKLTSLTLTIAEDTRDAMMPFFDESPKMMFFRNPAPAEFSEFKLSPRKHMKHILVVSNHPPQEVLDAAEILKRKGYDVKSLGETGDEYKLITPELLHGYDVVVTIGKTVQYCLCMGVPVFIYDRFGGPGYLDDSNFISAKSKNFSGRGFSSMSAAEIADHIMDGYTSSRSFIMDNRQKFIQEFSIDKVLPRVLKGLRARSYPMFSSQRVESIAATQKLANRSFVDMRTVFYLARDNRSLVNDNRETRKELEEERKQVDALMLNNRRSEEKIAQMWNSQTFRIGRAVTFPMTTLKNIVCKFLHK